MDTDDLKGEQGTCPKCQHLSLDYDAGRIQDEYVIYRYECSHCGHVGEEVYRMMFVGHSG